MNQGTRFATAVVTTVIVLLLLALAASTARAQYMPSPVPPGTEIALWSRAHKRFVHMLVAPMNYVELDSYKITATMPAASSTPPASLPATMTAERFMLTDLGGAVYALRNQTEGRFIRTRSPRTDVVTSPIWSSLTASAQGERFAFRPAPSGGGKVQLYFPSGGLTLQMDARGAISAQTAPSNVSWTEFDIVVTEAAPITAPPGWQFSPGQPGKPAVLLIHGLAASSLHFTNPLEAWNVKKTHYDHDRAMGEVTGSILDGLFAVEGSPNDPQSDPDHSMWAYLVDQGFSVATWDQAPCVEDSAIPTSTCLDSDTFDNAYRTAPHALAMLASVTTGDIVLVGHSRGGLIVRKLLKESSSVPGRNRVKTAITVHTPHGGTSMAGRGTELEGMFSSMASIANSRVPAAISDVIGTRLSDALGTPNAIIAHLVTTVGLRGARELSLTDPVYTALAAGEVKPAGVRVYTFGGNSVNVWKLHAWVWNASGKASPIRLLSLPDDLNSESPFPEMKPGVGDLLVTDTASNWTHQDQHFTNPLNHGEVLWSHAVHRKIHELILATTLPPESVPTPPPYVPVMRGSVTDAMATIRALPVFNQLGAAVTAVMNGDFITLNASASDVVLEGFAGAEHWHVGAGFTDPTLFKLSDDLKSSLGTVTINSVAVVVAGGAETVPLADLPPGIKTLVTDFAVGGAVDLRQGVNLFAKVTPSDSGVVGVLKGSLGLGSGSIRISGSVGAEMLHRALVAAGVPMTGSEPGPTEMHLKVVLPRLVPVPFNAINKKEALHLELDETTLTVDRVAGNISIGAAFDGRLWVMNNEYQVPVALSYTRGSGSSTVAVTGSIAGNLDPFDLGMPLTSLGVSGSYTFSTSAAGASAPPASARLAVTAGVKLASSTVTGQFAISTSGGSVDEISVSIPTGIALQDLGLTMPPFHQMTITSPAIGLRMSTKEAYVAGGVSWPGHFTAEGVLYFRKRPGSTGFAVFARTQNVDLKTALGLPAVVPSLPLPDFTFVASTVALTNVPLTDLPVAAREMVDDVATSGNVTFASGVAVIASLDTSKAPLADLAGALGAEGALTITGTVSGIGTAAPGFSLAVALPTFKIPESFSKVLTKATGSLFLALQGTQLSVGVSADMGMKLDGQPLTLRGKIYGVLGPSGAGLQVSGKLVGMWNNPFGLTGVGFGDLTASLGLKADGSIDVGLGGTASFSGKSYSMAGFTSVLLSSGLPVPKGIGIRFTADEMSPTTPLEIGETLLKAFANVARNNGTITETEKSKIDAMNLASTIKTTVPLANVKLTGVELKLCTPGMSNPDLPICDGGFSLKAAGKLWYAGTELGSMDASFATTGFSIKTSGPKDFTLGPLTIRSMLLDIGASIPGIGADVPPHFYLKGNLSLFGVNPQVDVKVSATELSGSFKVQWGTFNLVTLGFTSVGGIIAPTDFKLTVAADLARIRQAIGAGVKALVDGAPGSALRSAVTSAKADVAAAEQRVATAMATADRDRQKVNELLTQAQAQVTAMNNRVTANANELKTAETNLANAGKFPPNLPNIAKYTAQIVALKLERPTLQTFLSTANSALAAAQAAVTNQSSAWLPLAMHPAVIDAQRILNDAKIKLAVAELAVSGMDGVANVAVTLVNSATGSVTLESFKLIDASLKDALDPSKTQLLEIVLKINGTLAAYRQNISLANPGAIALDEIFSNIFRQNGGEPTPAQIDTKLATVDLGYGEVVWLQDKARNGTSNWATPKPIGAPGWSELGYLIGGQGGVVWGMVPGKTDLVRMIDTSRAGAAAWDGPRTFFTSYWFEGAVGGLNGVRFLAGEGSSLWVVQDNGKIFNRGAQSAHFSGGPYSLLDYNARPDFDGPGTRGRGKFARVFGGDDGVLYGITWSGELWCHNYQSALDRWDMDGGTPPKIARIGSGWNRFTQVFGGQDGMIYAVETDGRLRWYKHTGRADCTATFLAPQYIGTGWNQYRQVIGGQDGVFYAVPARDRKLTPGRQVALYSPASQRYLRMNVESAPPSSSPMLAVGTDVVRDAAMLPRTWTSARWQVVDGGVFNGKPTVAFWNPESQRFLRVNAAGDVDSYAVQPGAALNPAWAWERFEIESYAPGKVRLYNRDHKKYLRLNDLDATVGASAGTTLTNGYPDDVFEIAELVTN